eukprot:TRINITY_DN14215_c0_g1_i3.p2 TRINITY_DN14215_c0_g1~~TRINITY_DN14215_c0_g1_i3.p2  ORF type:complete len:335 (+),score=89.96 TRINITY_DN14215_c0_g1_i3:145-1149(+)
MIRRPPRSTHCISSAASDVYKRQIYDITQFRKEFIDSKKFYLGENITNWLLDHKKKEIFENVKEVVLEQKFGKEKSKTEPELSIQNESQDQPVKGIEEVKQGQQQQDEKIYANINTQCIIQKYIENPLLLDGRKFDIRCYVLIASLKPSLVLFHQGYLRLCLDKYSGNDKDGINNKFAHLTNAAVQKKHPKFQTEKETSIWSMKQFEEYLMKNHKKSVEDIENIYNQMKEIAKYTIKAGLPKLEKKIGYYELLGYDIMIDDNFKPHLLEINTNPALFLDTIPQKEIIPIVVNKALDIVLYLNEDSQKIGDRVKEIQKSQIGNYDLIYNEMSNEK